MSNHPDGPPKSLSDLLAAVFINREKELRSGWRVLLFFLAFVMAIIFIRGVVDTLARLIPSLRFLVADSLSETSSDRLRLLAMLIGALETLAAAFIASFVCARWLERRTLRSVGFMLHRRWAKDFALGSLIGGASLAFAVGMIAAVGAAHFAVQLTDKAALIFGFGYLLVFFLVAGAVEELIFRGFVFQALLHNVGAFPALAITAILFGLAHIDNTNVSAFAIFNTVLAGVWLGIAYLQTRSLWLATALHYSWNFVMIFVFGLNVSGIPDFAKLAWLHGGAKPPWWISGGDYGPEGGAAATLALLLSTLLIWKSGWFRATADMLAATTHGKPERSLSIIANDETSRA